MSNKFFAIYMNLQTSWKVFSFFFFFFDLFIYLREREQESGIGVEREILKLTPHWTWRPMWGLIPGAMKSWPELKPRFRSSTDCTTQVPWKYFHKMQKYSGISSTRNPWWQNEWNYEVISKKGDVLIISIFGILVFY